LGLNQWGRCRPRKTQEKKRGKKATIFGNGVGKSQLAEKEFIDWGKNPKGATCYRADGTGENEIE